MHAPRSLIGWFLAASLTALTAGAEPGIHVAPATAPPVVDARTRTALHDTVASALSEDAAAVALDGYTVFPRLLELRRYVEGNAKTATLFCAVELTVVDDRGDIVGTSRASAKSAGATQQEVIDVAAHAAAQRMTVTLAALERANRNSKAVARK